MSLRLKPTVSKNSVSYSIIGDVTDPVSKKRTTAVYQALGNLQYWFDELHTDSQEVVETYLHDYAAKVNEEYNAGRSVISISYDPTVQIDKDKQVIYNAGYLYVQKVLSMLRLQSVCKKVSGKYKFEFDLWPIVSDLVCARFIDPSSKRNSYELAKRFLSAPSYELHDVYRALPVLAQNRYEIESSLYKHSQSVCERNSAILYYDCTNFYFEIEEAEGEKQYGKSKENRPNPIVQYGLFMDGNGIPLADYVFSGNRNEQPSLRELEEIIEKDFGHSKFIVVADAGLNGWENKVLNDRDDKAYIVTQPIKKLNKTLKNWSLDPSDWHLLETPGVLYDISDLPEKMLINGKTVKTDDLTFYKDRWITETKMCKSLGKKTKLDSRLIVSFNTRFQKYQEHIREKKLERAYKLLENPGKLEKKDPRNPTYYIRQKSDEKEKPIYEIDQDKIAEDVKYDGYYAVNTDLEDPDIAAIVKVNRQRWEIEESFRIMKSEFKTRPMFVKTDEAIEGHLLICFMALLAYRIIEQKLEGRFTQIEIIEAIKTMNLSDAHGFGYLPAFERTDVTDGLKEVFGFSFDTQIVPNPQIKKILKNCKSHKKYAEFEK